MHYTYNRMTSRSRGRRRGDVGLDLEAGMNGKSDKDKAYKQKTLSSTVRVNTPTKPACTMVKIPAMYFFPGHNVDIYGVFQLWIVHREY